MLNKIKTISFFLILSIAVIQLNVYGISGFRLIEGEITTDILPMFKYDRYHIELDTRTDIELLLPPDAKIVQSEVTDAQGAVIGVDSISFQKNGLKIIKTGRLRNNSKVQQLAQEERASTYKATFKLNKIRNLQKTSHFFDYKIFKITIKAFLPGTYTIRAIVDGKKIAITKIHAMEDFRIDEVSPFGVDIGLESLITIQGKGLDAFTQVYISGGNIQIKEIESFNDGVLKVQVFVLESADLGFHDVTITSPALDTSATLVNALYIGPRIGQNGKDGKDSMDGATGPQGLTGKDGMSFCENTADLLMVFANNLPPGSQATSFFDPVLCSLTLGIPVGFNGINGTNGASGIDGRDGMSVCTNMNTTLAISSIKLTAGSTPTSSFSPNDCTLILGIPEGETGATGSQGLPGINCWDLNGNRTNDPNEDINKDGVFDTKDCQKKDKD